jgi:hypothetical protein
MICLGRWMLSLKIGCGGRTADPSTSLRFGRDDKGRVVTCLGCCDWDVWISGGVIGTLSQRLKSLRENSTYKRVPKGRLRVAQDASPGLGKSHEQSRRDG